jgi:hypothetical protein
MITLRPGMSVEELLTGKEGDRQAGMRSKALKVK